MKSSRTAWSLRRWLTVSVIAVLLVYWGSIFVATHTPPVHLPTDLPYNDKLAHFGAYAGLSFLLTLTLYIVCRFRWAWLPLVVTIAAIYGLIDEFTQAYVGRQPDVRDWLADVAGAMLGAIGGLSGFLLLRGMRRWLWPAANELANGQGGRAHE